MERAHREGALTHASLMVAGAAAADAVARARRLPDLRVGLHLVAVEGPAVLPAAAIPDLVDASGWFPSDQLRLGLRYSFSRRARRQLAREVAAQFAAFAATGLSLSHADAHKHMHLHPYVGRLLVDTGRLHGLQRVRVPAEPPAVMRALGVRQGFDARAMYAWTRVLRRQVRAAGMTAPDAVFGLAWTGHVTEGRIAELLDAVFPPHPSPLPRGARERASPSPPFGGEGRGEGAAPDVELYFHPAAYRDALLDRLMPDYEHEAELAALLSPAARAARAAAPARTPGC